jgi:hypothetical protein
MVSVKEVEKLGVEEIESDGEEVSPSLMRLETLTFTLQGISPLLQNNPSEFIGQPSGDAMTGKKKYNDEEEARKRTYVDASGHFVHPTESVVRAIVRAARGKKFGKVSAPDLLKASVFPAQPFAKLVNLKGRPLKEYTIDRRGVVVQRNRILRCRPCWPEWQLVVELEVDVSLITSRSILVEVLTLAGRFPGLGDFRPEKGGAFGRFVVKE